MPKARAREEALAFTVFVDGLWLRAAVDNGRWSAAEARRLCYQYVERQIGLKISADIIAGVDTVSAREVEPIAGASRSRFGVSGEK